MKTPVSWIREYAALPDDLSTEDLARRLTALGLKVEALERPGAEIRGPLVVGRVLTVEPEPQKNGKTINWCQVRTGPTPPERDTPSRVFQRNIPGSRSFQLAITWSASPALARWTGCGRAHRRCPTPPAGLLRRRRCSASAASAHRIWSR